MSESKINVQTLIVTVIISVVLSVGAFAVMKDGFIGPAGEQGIQGIDGTQGIEGIQGIQGESIIGPKGEPGEEGHVWITNGVPMVSITGKNKRISDGTSLTYLSGVCGEDYRLTSPRKADIWNVTVCVVSGLPGQNVFIRIFEVVGEYPYDYLNQVFAPSASAMDMVVLTAILDPFKTYEVWIRDNYSKPFIAVIEEQWNTQGGYVVNGDFEADSYNVVGWETGGHTGGGSGEDSIDGRLFSLNGDSGATATQTVSLFESDLDFEFYYRPFPYGTPIEFIVSFDDIEVFHEVFNGTILPWSSVKVELSPYLDTLGEHTIKFVVPKNEGDGSRVSIDKVSIS